MKVLIGSYRRDAAMITACLDSLTEHVSGCDGVLFVADNHDPEWIAHLESFGMVGHRGPDTAPWGFSGALRMATAWMRHLRGFLAEDYFCWWEEDTVAEHPIDLDAMADQLCQRPHLAQLALVRQPVYDAEVAAGGVLEYIRSTGSTTEDDGILVQQQVFTTNPAVWAPGAYASDWPSGPNSEAAKTTQLVAEGLAFGYVVGQQIRHTGELRQGVGY